MGRVAILLFYARAGAYDRRYVGTRLARFELERAVYVPFTLCFPSTSHPSVPVPHADTAPFSLQDARSVLGASGSFHLCVFCSFTRSASASLAVSLLRAQVAHLADVHRDIPLRTRASQRYIPRLPSPSFRWTPDAQNASNARADSSSAYLRSSCCTRASGLSPTALLYAGLPRCALMW